MRETLPNPDQALLGRDQPIVQNLIHFVNQISHCRFTQVFLIIPLKIMIL